MCTCFNSKSINVYDKLCEPLTFGWSLIGKSKSKYSTSKDFCFFIVFDFIEISIDSIFLLLETFSGSCTSFQMGIPITYNKMLNSNKFQPFSMAWFMTIAENLSINRLTLTHFYWRIMFRWNRSKTNIHRLFYIHFWVGCIWNGLRRKWDYKI